MKNFWSTLFLLICFFCFVLSTWQIFRGLEKANLISKMQDNKTINQDSNGFYLVKEENEFNHINVGGHFMSTFTIYLSNKIFNQQIGYEVLVPFKSKNNYFLVKIGWVKKENKKEMILPIVKVDTENKLKIDGFLKKPSNLLVLKEEKIIPKRKLELQNLMIGKISDAYKIKFEPLIIVSTEGSLPMIETSINSLSPHRHYGYAIQWFLFGVFGLIIFYLKLRVIKYEQVKN
ncbi:hypothetical protein CF386_03775 [Paraphotobacterium marinum]|uniref:SURF1-like protein n=1 Tax=Paraphotobacterium marinum TaxID=1755811 RepID=A0A220VD64_9GAMM|nr:SURF1 family protein [Paraphotobacterium marinum]ASK78211.1 hypothetical protein CF386_03775 [Paraphotobacterium marinum]